MPDTLEIDSAEISRIIAGLTTEHKSFIDRFDLSSGNDALLQVENAEQDIIANELLHIGLIAHVRAVLVFAQLTELGLAVREKMKN